MKFTHVTETGAACMVDVSGKMVTHREATASGKIRLQPHTVELIKKQLIKKGDVLAVARVAAINGAKDTSRLIPLCHNIPLNLVEIWFSL
ncbi:MAG: cyclic pyranopterin monophosphate synthase MoaC, partial [Anaerolineales bacterium]